VGASIIFFSVFAGLDVNHTVPEQYSCHLDPGPFQMCFAAKTTVGRRERMQAPMLPPTIPASLSPPHSFSLSFRLNTHLHRGMPNCCWHGCSPSLRGKQAPPSVRFPHADPVREGPTQRRSYMDKRDKLVGADYSEYVKIITRWRGKFVKGCGIEGLDNGQEFRMCAEHLPSGALGKTKAGGLTLVYHSEHYPRAPQQLPVDSPEKLPKVRRGSKAAAHRRESLTPAARAVQDHYESKLTEDDDRIAALRDANDDLRARLKQSEALVSLLGDHVPEEASAANASLRLDRVDGRKMREFTGLPNVEAVQGLHGLLNAHAKGKAEDIGSRVRATAPPQRTMDRGLTGNVGGNPPQRRTMDRSLTGNVGGNPAWTG
jgi:hypothetical protein